MQRIYSSSVSLGAYKAARRVSEQNIKLFISNDETELPFRRSIRMPACPFSRDIVTREVIGETGIRTVLAP